MANKIVVAPQMTKDLQVLSRYINELGRAIEWFESAEILKDESHIKERLLLAKELLESWKKEPTSSKRFCAAYHLKNIGLHNIGLVLSDAFTYRQLKKSIHNHLKSALHLLEDEREQLRYIGETLRTLDEE